MNPLFPKSAALVTAHLAEILPSFSFYMYSAPISVLFIGAVVALLVGVFRSDPDRPNLPAYGIALASCLAAALVPLVLSFRTPVVFLSSGFVADGLSQFSFVVIALGTLFTLLAASLTANGRQLLRPELVCLLLLSSSGMMVMTAAGEFMSFFVGLEIMSVSLYVLVGYQRQNNFGLEAALKYFIMGATAAGITLMGMALIYLNTGSLKWADLAYLSISPSNPFGLLGMLFLVSGLAFKIALVPFHKWAPDVYEGANSMLTGYMATLVKLSMIIVFIRILGAGVREPGSWLVQFFWVCGALSIIVGSIFGLVNNSIKRMLAYSSVANAGYFALGFATLASNPQSQIAREALIAYAAAYAVLNLGSFAVLSWLEEGNREDLLKEELAGLGNRSPFAAFALTVFLFGLAGIPPLAGFFGKFLLINAAVSQGLVGLSVILVLFSCISLYYYLSLMVEMWFKPDTRNSVVIKTQEETRFMKVLVGFAVALSLVIGVVGPRWAVHVSDHSLVPPAHAQKLLQPKVPSAVSESNTGTQVGLRP